MFIESSCLFQMNSETCWKGNNRLFLSPSSAKEKKAFTSYIEKWGSSELAQPAKKLQAQNFDIKPALFRMSSFFHLSTVASLADGRLRCGNQQKSLWCRNTGKKGSADAAVTGFQVGRPEQGELLLNPKKKKQMEWLILRLTLQSPVKKITRH